MGNKGKNKLFQFKLNEVFGLRYLSDFWFPNFLVGICGFLVNVYIWYTSVKSFKPVWDVSEASKHFRNSFTFVLFNICAPLN